ncbi:unnamed protein product [Chondrus crispus]|uniref:AAA+ ATPase domain-containing protein n=1 Tax=Chondrus crispus TaxID=2769 RepID=R7QR17_CHOCR|nr:unnamed protein product [Chondrus crispus]CDF40203.1 unnamed protein product [Chondrus crispus]|eukprot:XP_005710497.1 unnamed protein product [Chondrus crispus]
MHIVHYSVGEPQKVNGTLSTLRELLIVGLDGSKKLRNFATEISQWSVDKDIYDGNDHKFSLYRYQFCYGSGQWSLEGVKRSRTPASVILPAMRMNNILEDVKHFLKVETRKWYVEHGMPHRRSFLFFGPPGTGKTSTIRVIASQFQLNCCFLSMTNPGFSNQDLAQALTVIPANALLVLEDVDALFNKDRTSAEAPNLSFSSFLNALDGLISADGVITVMTTNHIAKLDSALIRGGRVDRRFHFPSPDEEQIKQLFMSFYPEAGQEVAQEFVRAVFSRLGDKEARSIATLQQLFIDQRENSAEECARSVASFFERFYPKGDTSLRGADHIYG